MGGADDIGLDTPIGGWESFTQALARVPQTVLAKLPLRMRADPQIRSEVGRLILAALTARGLDALAADGDHPVFLPSLNLVLNVYQPNADTIYRQAAITPRGVYRLRGRKGSLRFARIAVFAPPSPSGAIRAEAIHDVNALEEDAEGHFQVLMSATRPEGYRGDWWPLDPRATNLLLRLVAYDWSKERDPTLSIERVDRLPGRPRPSAQELQRRLSTLAGATEHTAAFLVDHVETLRREGYVNRLKVWDVTANFGGVFGQFYYEGVYELGEDEALILETEYPERCTYASLLLTNEIFETTDWYNNHSSLNGAQWRLDSDGRLRVVISAQDPGVHNWLDTAGHPTGVVQGRWLESSATPIPVVMRVPLARLEDHVPADTPRVSPKEREHAIRERRAQLQQRPLW